MCEFKRKIMTRGAKKHTERRNMKKELLKEELEKRGMNQLDLANLSGLTPSTVSRILNGDRECGVRIAAKITNALKLKPATACKIFFED